VCEERLTGLSFRVRVRFRLKLQGGSWEKGRMCTLSTHKHGRWAMTGLQGYRITGLQGYKVIGESSGTAGPRCYSHPNYHRKTI
jgi:hypothetical protein